MASNTKKTAVAPGPPKVKAVLTQEELSQVASKWQRRLRLGDWKLYVAVVPSSEMMEGASGQINTILTSKIGWIKVLDPAHYSFPEPQDMERTLVHEMVHCHFAPFMVAQGNAKYVAQEQAIELLADALVEASRNGV